MPSHNNREPRLVRVSGREHWYISYYDGNQSKRLSTKTTAKAKAQAALEDFIEGRCSTKVTDPTVEQLLALYIADRASMGKNPDPLKYRAKRLVAYFRDTLASRVTREKGRLYADRQLSRPYSRKTIGDDLSLLRSALKFAKEERWVETVPTIDIPQPPDPKERYLTEGEARKLLRAAKAFHLNLFINIALNTAARPAAILDLRWEQVNFVSRTVNLNPPGRKQTAKVRPTVPINDTLYGALKLAQKRAVSDFVVEWAGCKVDRVSKSFRSVAKRAKLAGVTPYTLRHTAATWMAERGVPLDQIAAMLGHKRLDTTYRIYMKHTPAYLRHAAEALNLRRGLSIKPQSTRGKRCKKTLLKVRVSKPKGPINNRMPQSPAR